MNKKIRISEPWWLKFPKLIAPLYARAKGFKLVGKYKAQKGERVVVLSNHVTDLDPVILRMCVNRFLYTLSTDNIYSTKFTMFWLPRLGGVPKRKGISDFESVKNMMYIASKGGSILLFPEGNRAYAEFQYYIAPNFASLLYKLKSTIVLYNIKGGFGSYPRWGKKRRKGPLSAELKMVLKYDEYKDTPPEKLNEIITTNLQYFDSGSGNKYKSNCKAEYLERMFFICPKCGKLSTLHSQGDHLKCSNCGLDVEYTEDLKLTSKDENFKFTKLVEWYNYQKQFVKNMNINDGIIFEDKNVELSKVNPFVVKEDLAKGKLVLTKDKLSVDNVSFDIKDILTASPMSGRKLLFTIGKDNYQIKGNERFNALKYVLLFNKLETRMNLEKVDNYFNL